MGLFDLRQAAVPAATVKPNDTLVVGGRLVTVTSVRAREVSPAAWKTPIIRVTIRAGGYTIHTNPQTQLIKLF